MDGTLSWEPFVEQTIAMARNVHKCKYRMGVGYKLAEDGTVTEKYWEQVNEAEEEHQVEENSNAETQNGKPYRIELVGVVCDGYLAVIRGMRYISLCIQLIACMDLLIFSWDQIWHPKTTQRSVCWETRSKTTVKPKPRLTEAKAKGSYLCPT